MFVRGHAPNRDGWVANPSSDPDGAERAIWAATARAPGTAVANRPWARRRSWRRTAASVLFVRDGQIYRARVTPA